MSFVHLDGVSYITRDTTFFVTFFFGYGGVGYRYYNGLRALGAHLGNPELIQARAAVDGQAMVRQTKNKHFLSPCASSSSDLVVKSAITE